MVQSPLSPKESGVEVSAYTYENTSPFQVDPPPSTPRLKTAYSTDLDDETRQDEARQDEESLPEDLSFAISHSNRENENLQLTSTPTLSSATSMESKSRTEPQSTPERQSFLTRKAHRFSSLKKRRGATSMLQKILCGSPTNKESAAPAVHSMTSVSMVSSGEMLSQSNSSETENHNPGSFVSMTTATATVMTLQEEKEPPCSAPLTDALENARDSFALKEEERVRNAIQVSFQEASDTVMEACSSPFKKKHSSPPTVSNSFAGSDEEKLGERPSSLLLETPAAVAKSKPMNTPALGIPTPFQQVDMFPQTFSTYYSSSKSMDKSPLLTMSAEEKEDIGSTSLRSSETGEYSSSSPARSFPKLGSDSGEETNSNYKSPLRIWQERELLARSSSSSDTVPLGSAKSPVRTWKRPEGIDRSNSKSPIRSWREDTQLQPSRSNDSLNDSDPEPVIPAPPKLQNLAVPVEALAPDSSNLEMKEDGSSSSSIEKKLTRLSTVDEGSSSKEETQDGSTGTAKATEPTDSDDDAFLPDDFKAKLPESDARVFAWPEVQKRILDAVSCAKKEYKASLEDAVRKEIEQEQAYKLEEAKSQAEQMLHEHGEQWKKEYEVEMKILKKKYEHKINEQKDQVAVAQRFAKTRAEEAERTLEKLRELETATSELSETKVRLAELEKVQRKEDGLTEIKSQNDKSTSKYAPSPEVSGRTETDRVKKQLFGVKAKLAEKEEEAKKAKSLQKELDQVNAKLAEKEEEAKKAKSLQKELVQINAKLAEKEEDAKRAKDDAELVKKELTAVKGKLFSSDKSGTSDRAEHLELEFELARVKKELEEVKKSKYTSVESLPELDYVKQELADVTERLATSKDYDQEKVSQLESELEQTQEQLAEAKTQLESKETQEEVIASLQSELEVVKSKLAEKEKNRPFTFPKPFSPIKDKSKSPPPSKSTPTIQNVRRELAEVKEKLAFREKEIEELKAVKRRSATPNRRSHASPVSTPTRPLSILGSPHRTPSRPSGGRKSLGGPEAEKHHQKVSDLVEMHEKEKESLRQQIAKLEEQAADSNAAHEEALRELRTEGEMEIMRVRKDLEDRVEKHMIHERELRESLSTVSSREKEDLLEQIEKLQSEKKDDRNGGLREVQKKEDLLSKIAALEANQQKLMEDHEQVMQDLRSESDAKMQRIRREMELKLEKQVARERELELAISQTSSYEKEELLKLVEKLQGKLDAEQNGAVLLKMKLSNFEKEFQAVEKEHDEALANVRSTIESETKVLKEQLQEQNGWKKTMESARAERDSLAIQVLELQQKLESVPTESAVKELEERHLAELKNLKAETETRITTIQQEAKREVELQQQRAEERFNALAKESAAQIEELKNEASQKDLQGEGVELVSSSEDRELRKQLSEFEVRTERAEQSKERLENKIKQLEEGHTRELDEVLSQLDLVEAEHKEMILKKEETLTQKDAIIVALGTQLAQAQTRIKGLEDSQSIIKKELDSLRIDVEKSTKELKLKTKDLEESREKHALFVRDSDAKLERACENAREEMIQKAEAQFKQANGVYMKLKKQYDASREKTDQLDKKMKDTLGQLEEMRKEKESLEVELQAEIAQLKASKARTEADAAMKAKDYRREMEGLLQAAKDFEAKRDEAELTSKSVQRSLASVVAEKNKLHAEFNDMKGVCEELMAMVETQQNDGGY